MVAKIEIKIKMNYNENISKIKGKYDQAYDLKFR
jgi:hypothetical protein